MVDSPRVLGIASVAKLCNTYKALLRKCRHNKKPSSKEAEVAQLKANNKGISEELQGINDKQKKGKIMNGVHSFGCNSQNIHGEHDHDQTSPRSSRGGNNSIYKHRSADNCFPFSYMSCSPLPRNSTPQMRSISRKSSTGSSPLSLPFLGKNLSRRSSNNIMFSNSSGLLKPPAIEKKLECTLEELCYGCQKKIKITRDVVKHNGFVP